MFLDHLATVVDIGTMPIDPTLGGILVTSAVFTETVQG
jgi:hypothetical protein